MANAGHAPALAHSVVLQKVPLVHLHRRVPVRLLRIAVLGARKVWGSLRSTTVSAVANAICSVTNIIPAADIPIKRSLNLGLMTIELSDGGLCYVERNPLYRIWRAAGTN